ncbi:hypothetical protein [Fusobacterium varium]|uniref:hypothetical protein n=1 Tax=Fusobacterium varium TaxID=856 RepID=UPI000E4126ED|nr:hypothetical protein [Fusobacterium varium]MCI6034210.1 hypothetical protein [Fusobacterium varium]MDY4005913.1 hypothetical protein [Fusobacterium varium]RGJ28623.1 hypothetical protein DXD66_07700 [Fusobacterium varium]
MEDKAGMVFKCKFRKPTTSELLKIKREYTYIKTFESDKEEEGILQIQGLEMKKIAQLIFDKFDCLPAGLEVDMLKSDSILIVVNTFYLSN